MTRQVLVDAEALERLLSPREARRMWGGPGAPLGIEKQCRYCEFPHDAHAEGCPVPVLQAALAQPTPAPAEALSNYKRSMSDTSFNLDLQDALDMAYQAVGCVETEEVGWGPDVDRTMATLGAAYVATLKRVEVAEAQRDRLLAGLEKLTEGWSETTGVGVCYAAEEVREVVRQAVDARRGTHVISLEHDEASSQWGMREAAERVARSVLSRTEGEASHE